MELRHLRTFVAVAEEQSITRAARRLLLAQPAVSRQLMELERHVGLVLFIRHARGTRLTTAGRLLLPEATEILRRAARWGEPRSGVGRDADQVGDPSPTLTRSSEAHRDQPLPQRTGVTARARLTDDRGAEIPPT